MPVTFGSKLNFKQIRNSITLIIHNGACLHIPFDKYFPAVRSLEGEFQLGSGVFQTDDTGRS